MTSSSPGNFVYDVLEEVALEGLDGITLDTLWIRLRHRQPVFPFDTTDESVQEYLWKAVLSNRSIVSDARYVNYYVLPEDRIPFVYFDRYAHLSEEDGCYVEREDIPKDPYAPISPANDGKGTRGSCASFKTRIDVTESVYQLRSLSELLSTYDVNQLVIVASQKMREEALGVTPFNESISDRIYCYLEYVGRMRHLGCITFGNEIRDAMGDKSSFKSAFYCRKVLLNYGLIRKTGHYHTSTKNRGIKGLVVFLKRFYNKRTSSLEKLAIKISDTLLNHEELEYQWSELKKVIDPSGSRRASFKNVIAIFPGHFELYFRESLNDETGKTEKRKFIRLISPVTEETVEEKDEEQQTSQKADLNESLDDLEIEETTNFTSEDQIIENGRLFNPSTLLADRPMLSQVLTLIETSNSPQGLSMTEIGKRLSLHRLDTRTFMHALVRRNCVKTIKVEQGRTKVSRFMPLFQSGNTIELPAELASQGLTFDASKDTVKMISRCNTILEMIRSEPTKIVSGLYTFVREIRTRESLSGSDQVIDQKSVARLLIRLRDEGHIKIHKFIRDSPVSGKPTELIVVTDPSIQTDDEAIQEALRVHWFNTDRPKKESEEKQSKTKVSMEMTQLRKDLKEDDSIQFEYQLSAAKKYGLEPKMRRILTFYRFLFHQVYTTGSTEDDQASVYDDWRKNLLPLPNTRNHSCMLGELIPRIPLIIFCQVVSIPYVIPELVDYLNDKEARLLPLLSLPPHIRQGLLHRRKYVYSLMEVLSFLRDMGLVEVDYKEQSPKDYVKIKVKNQFKFKFKDAISGKTILKTYKFTDVDDISVFEHELFEHCLVECGGCSLKENLFAHLYRSWSFGPNTSRAVSKSRSFKKTLSNFPLETHVLVNDRESLSASQVESPLKRSVEVLENDDGADIVLPLMKRQRRRRKQIDKDDQDVSQEAIPADRIRKKMKRKESMEDSESEKRPKKRKYDDKDIHALSILGTKRACWTTSEDNFLLLCRVASVLLDPSTDREVARHSNLCIPVRYVRDELHKFIPYSNDKTAVACQRRIMYMLKDDKTSQNINDWVAEFKQDEDFGEISSPSVPKTHEEAWKEAYLAVLKKVLDKFMSPESSQFITINDSSIGELPQDISNYNLIYSRDVSTSQKRKSLYIDPKNVVDIHVHVVDNVLLASLLTEASVAAFSYTLFRIYQRYPDSLIRSVVSRLRSRGVMSSNKSSRNDKKKAEAEMKQHGVTPFKIASHYKFLLSTKYNVDSLFHAITNNDKLHFTGPTSDRRETAIVASLLTTRNADFSIDIPDDLISIDASYNKKKKWIGAGNRDKTGRAQASRSLIYSLREQFVLKKSSGGGGKQDKQQDHLMMGKCDIKIASKEGYKIPPSFSEKLSETLKMTVPPLHLPNETRLPMPQLLHLIKQKKELGAQRDEIIALIGRWPERELDRLLSSFIVFKLGVNSVRYVHHSFLTPWLVQANKRNFDGTEEIIKYLPSLWRTPTGEADKRVIYTFMSAVIGHLMTFPGQSEESLLNHFSTIIPGVQLLEILDLLLGGKCIEVTEIPLLESPTLFKSGDTSTAGKTSRTIRCYDITPDALLLLSRYKSILDP